MIKKNVAKYFISPSVGLTPGILYIILFWSTENVFYALGISLAYSVICDIFLKAYTKASSCGILFLFNAFSLGSTLIVRLLLPPSYLPDIFYIALYFIIFTTITIGLTTFRRYINMYLRKDKSYIQKTYLNEIYNISYVCKQFLTLYLFILLIYSFKEEIDHSWNSHNVLYCFFPILLFTFIIAYQLIKTKKILEQLKKEDWLPIVNTIGEVKGKIARSISSKMKNKFMHPVVRVALINNGEIYLQKRVKTDLLDAGLYDHPFEKYTLFNHDIKFAAKNCISKALNTQELPNRFIVKYVFENNNTKRLIFLFVANIETKEQEESIKLLHGKFWTTKQIEENINDQNVFAECFRLEYEYLKNIVIHSEMINKKSKVAIESE